MFLVSDKPSPPRNLTIADITAETISLNWETPEDDGGSPIVHYIVEKRNLSRKQWQEVGHPTDLTHTVDKLHDGNQYLFKVYAENAYGISEPVELTEPVTAKNPYSKLHRFTTEGNPLFPFAGIYCPFYERNSSAGTQPGDNRNINFVMLEFQ